MSNQTQTINILILDDHAMFREGLARTLEREADLKVVGQCSNTAEAIAALSPEVGVVLLDVDLGNERALTFVEQAKQAGYGGQILVVTAGISNQEALRLLQAGAMGILHKRHSGQVLCESVRKVAAGESCLEPMYLTSLVKSVDRTKTAANPKLSERDRALLRHILKGLTNREIGEALEISEGAVKASLRLLFDKLNVKSRTQLVKVALEQYQDQI